MDRLTAAVCGDPGAAAWNREVLRADSATPDGIVTAGLALPLFGQRRLVLARGVAEIGARGIDRLRATLEQARSRPGGWPAEGTTLAFLAPGAGRRDPVIRLLPEDAQVELRPPVGRAVLGWLRARAQAAGLALTPGGAESLVALVGEDLGRLAGELDKAAVFVGDDQRVTEEVVRALVGESRVRQYWELSQALEEAEPAKALRVLAELLATGEEPTVVLGQITGHLRDVWRVKAGLAERRDVRRIAELLPRSRPAYAVERLMARATALPADALERGLRQCFEVERALKSGGAEPRAQLTALVVQLARA